MSRWERVDLNAEIIAYATTRVFRIMRVGQVYFVEHQHADDQWRVVAKSTPDKEHDSGRDGAFAWMAQANADLIAFVRTEQIKDRQRSAVPNGSRAHEAGEGHG